MNGQAPTMPTTPWFDEEEEDYEQDVKVIKN